MRGSACGWVGLLTTIVSVTGAAVVVAVYLHMRRLLDDFRAELRERRAKRKGAGR
jgi:hypothetical protein